MPHLYLAPPQGVTPSEFREDKTRVTGLPYSEKNYVHILSRFHIIPELHGQTDKIAISISRINVLTRDKNVTEAFNVH